MYYNEVITFVVCDSESLSDNSQDITDPLGREIRRQKKNGTNRRSGGSRFNDVKLKVRPLRLKQTQLEA